MKIKITDEFLWELYNAMENAVDSIPEFYPYPTIKTVLLGRKNSFYNNCLKKLGREKFSKLIYHLKVSGYIQSKNLANKRGVILTKRGIDKAIKASFQLDEKVKRKDGKWIMIIFDVPEKRKKSRELLRSVLQNMGYKIFQKSVWICPFDVSEKTEKALQMYNLDPFVKIFLIEEI